MTTAMRSLPAAVTMLTAGATRRLFVWRGFDGALGGSVMFYGVPEVLQPTHGAHPVSFQAFFRLRLPTWQVWTDVEYEDVSGTSRRAPTNTGTEALAI